jgi:hypothetical protein
VGIKLKAVCCFQKSARLSEGVNSPATAVIHAHRSACDGDVRDHEARLMWDDGWLRLDWLIGQ